MTDRQDDISFEDEAALLPWAQDDASQSARPAAFAAAASELLDLAKEPVGPFLEAQEDPSPPNDDHDPSATDAGDAGANAVPLFVHAPQEAAQALPAEVLPADGAEVNFFPAAAADPPTQPVLTYTTTPPTEAAVEEDDPLPDPEPFDPAPVQGGMWTIPMLCLGIAIIACCALIPQADENRRIVHQREQLRRDLEATEKQVQVNGEFLRKVADDPNLAERLAQRQMKIIREGTRVLELSDDREDEMSPYHLTTVAPPDPLPEYRPIGGALTRLCLDPHSRLYLMGGGMLLVAAGLVLGYAPRD